MTRSSDPQQIAKAALESSGGDSLVFAGPIACIVDEHTAFAAERFVAALRDQRQDVVVVGRRSAGRPTYPAPVAVLPWSCTTLAAPDIAWRRPSGELLDGVGVEPDVPVTWTRADVLSGRDPDVEAARAAVRR